MCISINEIAEEHHKQWIWYFYQWSDSSIFAFDREDHYYIAKDKKCNDDQH